MPNIESFNLYASLSWHKERESGYTSFYRSVNSQKSNRLDLRSLFLFELAERFIERGDSKWVRVLDP